MSSMKKAVLHVIISTPLSTSDPHLSLHAGEDQCSPEKWPHLLAPTGSDLARHGQKGVVFAGYHYDLNFLTIHGRSRFPGLNIWLSNGEKVEVKVPVGCLLIQTGKEVYQWYILRIP